MDIHLHLGAHRCATATFQSYLRVNGSVLAHRGLTCWTPERTRDGLMRGLVRHPERASVEDERLGLRSIGRLRVEMDRLEGQGQTGLLISDQSLLGTLRSNLAEARLYPLLQERLRRFVPAFEGRTLHIGLAIRSYEDYWTSALAHLLPQGAARPDTETLDFLTTQPRRWRHVISDIRAIFPNATVSVWSHERYAGRPDDVLAIFDPSAGDDGLARPHEWRNRSADLATLNKVMKARGSASLGSDLAEKGARWHPFDDDQNRVLRAEYRSDIKWLQAGAQGMARYIDGRQTPAHSPDRALDMTHAAPQGVAAARGQSDGIEERLGRPRAG